MDAHFNRFFYGGDMPSIAELIGLSGHSGVYFCNNCHCPQSALERYPNRIHALSSNSNNIQAIGSFPPRTLESIRHDHEEYITYHKTMEERKKKKKNEKNEKKKEAKDFNNCVRLCLVHTEIDNHLVPTPLHLIMGIAERLLDAIELKCREWNVLVPLQEILLEHNVRRSSAHGGRLTGDAATRLLSIPCDRIRAIPHSNNEEWIQSWCKLLSIRSNISHLIHRATPLCDHEVTRVVERCTTLSWKWHEFFPEQRTFPKLHVMCIDLPRFVQQHRTVRESILRMGAFARPTVRRR